MTSFSLWSPFGKIPTSKELSDVQTLTITWNYNDIINLTYRPCFGDVLSAVICNIYHISYVFQTNRIFNQLSLKRAAVIACNALCDLNKFDQTAWVTRM